MKAEIDSHGVLVITAETTVEGFALKHINGKDFCGECHSTKMPMVIDLTVIADSELCKSPSDTLSPD